MVNLGPPAARHEREHQRMLRQWFREALISHDTRVLPATGRTAEINDAQAVPAQTRTPFAWLGEIATEPSVTAPPRLR
jgi:hypothetical protein